MRRILISLTALTILLAPQLTFGADVDDLKAAYEQYLKAFHDRDLDKFMSLHREAWVNYAWNNPFPNVVNNNEWKQQLQQVFAGSEEFTITLIEPQYEVIGNTGITYGHRRWVVKPKDSKQETTFLRYMDTWAKVGGKWLIVAKHRSLLPTGNEN